MLTIVSRWETSQMNPELEWRMWKQLRGAFGINHFIMTPIMPELSRVARLDQYSTMEEALENCNGVKIFLEPNGPTKLSEVDWSVSDDVYIVLGNTQRGNSHLVQEEDINVRIDYPSNTDLYGINAAAIALAYMVGQ